MSCLRRRHPAEMRMHVPTHTCARQFFKICMGSSFTPTLLMLALLWFAVLSVHGSLAFVVLQQTRRASANPSMVSFKASESYAPKAELPEIIIPNEPGTWAYDTMSRRVRTDILKRIYEVILSSGIMLLLLLCCMHVAGYFDCRYLARCVSLLPSIG